LEKEKEGRHKLLLGTKRKKRRGRANLLSSAHRKKKKKGRGKKFIELINDGRAKREKKSIVREFF